MNFPDLLSLALIGFEISKPTGIINVVPCLRMVAPVNPCQTLRQLSLRRLGASLGLNRVLKLFDFGKSGNELLFSLNRLTFGP